MHDVVVASPGSSLCLAVSGILASDLRWSNDDYSVYGISAVFPAVLDSFQLPDLPCGDGLNHVEEQDPDGGGLLAHPMPAVYCMLKQLVTKLGPSKN